MKFTTVSVFAALAFVSSVAGQQQAWQQCGGRGWSGGTTCVSGYTCTFSNDYYSQCIPGSNPQPTTTRPQTTIRPTTTTRPQTTTTRSTASRTTTTTVTRTTSGGPAPTGTGYLIRAVQSPVFHLYLQNNAGKPVLGAESSGLRFAISNGKIQAIGSGLYLNWDSSATTSYKPLSFDAISTSTGWGLEGDTIITTNGSPLGRQLNFLTCGSGNVLYLATGNEGPSGQSCTMITLHLPCLC
ncbi:hypothetical protein HK097_008646 [Rhizophlyctis rosea]|uniref:CBM1 domain-containing protein n=1 Tax=Rhizophlyctis rosea TaxID=64517 RepID=A0AAD5X5E7_9FUNG|nr:hypothetical protein HK097_008646 [Rhizophlyctis rosea]